MADINKNLEICRQKLALTEADGDLMRELFLCYEGGRKTDASSLAEMEKGISGEDGYFDDQPLWLINKDGEIHLMSVIIDFLNERFPNLPEGCSMELPEEQERFAIEGILDEGYRILNGFSEKKTYGILCITGQEGCGKHFYFSQLASKMGLTLLTMDLNAFIAANGRDEASLSRALTSFYITAVLYDSLPVIETDSRLLDDPEYIINRSYVGFKNPETIIRAASRLFGTFCIALGRSGRDGKKSTEQPDVRLVYKDLGAPVIALEMPKLSAKLRREIINLIAEKDYLTGKPVPAHVIDLIAGKNAVSALPLGGYVRYVRSMLTRMSVENNTEFAFEPEYAGESNESLKLMRCVRTIDELKLPQLQKSQLQKICAMCKARENVLSDGGFSEKFSYGNGLSVLFYGAPGTGKTMAAEVIASSLGKPLYRVELSQLINKYIGETQKNIGRIFDEAEKNDCVLLFDEADAIFAKRGEVADAQDRYSNAETAYLLQRMESYMGICVLTTNLFQNFDEAFRRRITYMINFPMPDEKIRLSLWQEIFPKKTVVSEKVDFKLLAGHFELSGASIRNIAQHAALYAASEGCTEVGMEHIIDGILNEYSKTGKNLSDSQKEIIASYT